MNRVARTTVALMLAGCGVAEDPQQTLDEAKARVELAVAAADQARTALELLGILPVYDCGTPRRDFVASAMEGVRGRIGCATFATQADGDLADLLLATFPESGCEMHGVALSGTAVFRFSGGTDRMDVELDLRSLKANGAAIQAKAGYGTCSDAQRYWALAEGTLPKAPDERFRVDGHVVQLPGLPIIGGTELVLDGPAELVRPAGTDRVTLTELRYEIGDYLPKQGTLTIETADGHSVRATFDEVLWRLGRAEVSVDGGEPTSVPIVR